MNKNNTSTKKAKNVNQNIIIIAALAVLVIIFSLLNSNFVDRYNIVSMAQSLAPYAIMGLGVTFVIATGGIDLSIGTVCIASAVVAGKLYMDGMPLWAVIPVMIAIGLLFGFINGLLHMPMLFCSKYVSRTSYLKVTHCNFKARAKFCELAYSF